LRRAAHNRIAHARNAHQGQIIVHAEDVSAARDSYRGGGGGAFQALRGRQVEGVPDK
jgi:hypothetical protein